MYGRVRCICIVGLDERCHPIIWYIGHLRVGQTTIVYSSQQGRSCLANPRDEGSCDGLRPNDRTPPDQVMTKSSARVLGRTDWEEPTLLAIVIS